MQEIEIQNSPITAREVAVNIISYFALLEISEETMREALRMATQEFEEEK